MARSEATAEHEDAEILAPDVDVEQARRGQVEVGDPDHEDRARSLTSGADAAAAPSGRPERRQNAGMLNRSGRSAHCARHINSTAPAAVIRMFGIHGAHSGLSRPPFANERAPYRRT